MRLLPGFVCFFMVIAIHMPLTSIADILVSLLVPVPSSHTKAMSAITGALTAHGHHVTILTSSSVGTKGFQRHTYSRTVQYKFIDVIPGGLDVFEEDLRRVAFEKNLIKIMGAYRKIFSVTALSCECLFDDSATLALLKASHFNILIGDFFNVCDAMLGTYLGIPYIAVTTTMRYPFFNQRSFGIPFPSSYVPLGIFPLSDKMSFPERVASFFEHHIVMPVLGWSMNRALGVIKDKHGFAPELRVPDLIARAELWLCMTTFALDYPHPTAPNWVAIGNIADIPAKPLEKEYESFVEGSGDHGFIIFSLGSFFTELPELEMAEAFARVFSELPQRVIWRHTGTRPRNLGNNTMLVDWMPQNDLLGHPKARLLIYHGGLNGILEALYHGVPMVVMPLLGEQESVALRVEVKGMGVRLQKNSISYQSVKAAVTEVLYNSSYRKAIGRYSEIYRHHLSKPNQTVVFWVDHILKFGGSHLRSRALELNFIQLHSIDVLAFIVGLVLLIVFISYSCFKRCLSCCYSRKKAKED